MNRLRFKLMFALLIGSIAAALVAAQPGSKQQGKNPLQQQFDAAHRFEQAGDWPRAEQEWRRILATAANDPRVWTNLGATLSQQGKTDEAIAAWQRAIELDPQQPNPHFNIGLVLVRNSLFAEAIPPLQRALHLAPNNDAARRALALALVGTEKFPEASREIAQLLTKSPRDAGLLELAAQSFVKQRRHAEAVVVLRRRLALANPTAQLWAQLGDALDASGQTADALAAYKNALALEPESTLFRYGLSYLYWKLVQYDDAERELIEILRRDADYARAAFLLGDLYLTKGDAQRSLRYLEQASKAYPQEFDTRFALGRALVATGNHARGIEELRAAVVINDSIADGHFQLGRALMRAGFEVEGKQELERARELNEKQRSLESERFKKKP